ncbi:MAG TPA: response regulator transcription factor [Steroidobacteraceae bacterium]|jgi:two-component system, NarL family, invasion response regulator UvrY|nr:response regulator transcription factor [Steroidobacteraceae bacterium]HYP78915.1 response regulator transcription factor [Steroidobacteraceae bacterium]
MASILIADDHALVRAGLKQLLQDDGRFAHIAEASSGLQALDALRTRRFDLLILDINMPDRGGLDILKHVRAGHPDTKVLVLSGYPERQYAVNVIKAGASGYLSKDGAPDELLRAVSQILAGKRYVSASLAEMLVAELDVDHEKPLHSELSEREFQVFCKLAGGQSVSDIARELCLSVKTVSTYRSRVLEKMRFTSNADITSYALRNQLMN